MAAARRPAQGGPNGTAAKRIRKEITDLARENLGPIVLAPNESNIFLWRATIPGPVGSPYEGGVFEVDIRVPEDYPFSPPQLQFLTKVYHCNIAHTGAICLDLLKTAWSPALSLYKVVLSLSSLLTDPNPSDPLVPGIAQEYKRNRKKHDQTAREWVDLYAKPKPKPVVVAPTPAAPRAASRPRAIHRAGAASTPPPHVAGTRRTHDQRDAGPVTIVSDDDDDDHVEVLAESLSANGARAQPERRSKRQRTDGGHTGSADDVIVIDD